MQLFGPIGVTVMVPVMGNIPVLVGVKLGKLPTPLVGSPISVLLLVHE